jgi:hypothetical protein
MIDPKDPSSIIAVLGEPHVPKAKPAKAKKGDKKGEKKGKKKKKG